MPLLSRREMHLPFPTKELAFALDFGSLASTTISRTSLKRTKTTSGHPSEALSVLMRTTFRAPPDTSAYLDCRCGPFASSTTAAGTRNAIYELALAIDIGWTFSSTKWVDAGRRGMVAAPPDYPVLAILLSCIQSRAECTGIRTGTDNVRTRHLSVYASCAGWAGNAARDLRHAGLDRLSTIGNIEIYAECSARCESDGMWPPNEWHNLKLIRDLVPAGVRFDASTRVSCGFAFGTPEVPLQKPTLPLHDRRAA